MSRRNYGSVADVSVQRPYSKLPIKQQEICSSICLKRQKNRIVLTAFSRLVGNTFLKEASLELNIKEERMSEN